MKLKEFLVALYVTLENSNEGTINFANALTHGTIQHKANNPKLYYEQLLKLLNMYGDDILDGLGIKKEDRNSITLPDGWDWDSIEKFLSKEDDKTVFYDLQELINKDKEKNDENHH